MSKTPPFTIGSVPSPSWRPCTKSRISVRAEPIPRRTTEENSFTIQLSPEATLNPAAAIRRRASTPAWYQVELLAAIQARQAGACTSANAWKLGPSARIRHA